MRSRVPFWRWENITERQPSTQHCRVTRRKPFLTKRYMTPAGWEFATKPLNDSQAMRSKILRSDETKMELFGHISWQLVWRMAGTECHLINTISTNTVMPISCCRDVFLQLGQRKLPRKHRSGFRKTLWMSWPSPTEFWEDLKVAYYPYPVWLS